MLGAKTLINHVIDGVMRHRGNANSVIRDLLTLPWIPIDTPQEPDGDPGSAYSAVRDDDVDVRFSGMTGVFMNLRVAVDTPGLSSGFHKCPWSTRPRGHFSTDHKMPTGRRHFGILSGGPSHH